MLLCCSLKILSALSVVVDRCCHRWESTGARLTTDSYWSFIPKNALSEEPCSTSSQVSTRVVTAEWPPALSLLQTLLNLQSEDRLISRALFNQRPGVTTRNLLNLQSEDRLISKPFWLFAASSWIAEISIRRSPYHTTHMLRSKLVPDLHSEERLTGTESVYLNCVNQRYLNTFNYRNFSCRIFIYV